MKPLIYPPSWTSYISTIKASVGKYRRARTRKERQVMSNIEEKIARINELYHKSQKEGLTDAEKEEQAKLRREYIDSVKKNLRSQLDNIDIVNKDGSVENLGKKFDAGKNGN